MPYINYKESLGLVCECIALSNFIFSLLFVCVSLLGKGGGTKDIVTLQK